MYGVTYLGGGSFGAVHFKYVTIDIDGYRTGSMNEVLK